MSPGRRSRGLRSPTARSHREATEFVRDVSTPLLFDHSRRVFLWASLQAEQRRLDYDAELLYVGAMFHDVDLLEGHRSEHERFEIDGANAARAFLERHGLPEEQVMTVWKSIALEILDAYVELELAGEDPARVFPGTAIHLRSCPGCQADHDGLLEAARRFADVTLR